MAFKANLNFFFQFQAFDGDTWRRSPRTGYTYLSSASYRDTWTPEREIPMPHMARRPLDEFEGWEFSTKPAGDFSCDESETEPEISSLYLQQHYRLRSSSVNIFSFN